MSHISVIIGPVHMKQKLAQSSVFTLSTNYFLMKVSNSSNNIQKHMLDVGQLQGLGDLGDLIPHKK